MSLTLLNQKIDKLNEQETNGKQTYDVRGTNKQHRFIKDLKDEFKDNLAVQYGDKPYDLGWNQETELETDKGNQNEIAAQKNIPVEDEQEVEEEIADIMTSTLTTNFRPQSGKPIAFITQNRPISASTIRPITASSTGGNSNAPKLMFARPISAISKITRNNNDNAQEIDDFALLNVKGMIYQGLDQQNTQTDLQSPKLSQHDSAKIRASETIFWKNTKKFDNSRSAKQFNTKKLLFEYQHSDPKIISSSDLKFLKNNKMGRILEACKLKAPGNHVFQDIAQGKEKTKKRNNGQGSNDFETQNEVVTNFNQSLSYIHALRNETKVDTRASVEGIVQNQRKKPQRPLTAQPFFSSAATNNIQKSQLETVKEQLPENHQIYFSSLSDLRKKAFFLKLHALERAHISNPGLNKELKLIEWNCFKDSLQEKECQNIYAILIDLNTFDHMRYDLELQDGKLKAKDREDTKEINEVYKEFIDITKTNIAMLTIYYEAASNRMIEIFSRVVVYEKQENEYDIKIWKNIYRFLLHKMIMANSPLYPEFKTYQDLSRMIKDIMEDKQDYVSPISAQIQQSKDRPIVVERNAQVYNFDFHSYILECSSFYAQSLLKENRPVENANQRLKENKNVEAKIIRPASAADLKYKFSSFTQKEFMKYQDTFNKDASNTAASIYLASTQQLYSNPQGLPSSHRQEGLSSISDKSSTNIGHYHEENGRLVFGRGVRATSAKSIPSTQIKIDMTLQGGRMGIYSDIKAAESSVRSAIVWNNSMGSMNYPTGYLKSFNASVVQSPVNNFEDMFQKDPNGITVKYNSPMKRKNNIVVRKQPKPYQKKEIRPHDSQIPSSITTLIHKGTNNPFRFKF